MNDHHVRSSHWPVDESFDSVMTSVWPTGASSVDVQLAHRGYRVGTAADPALMAPAIAEYAITKLTRRGEVVADPDCGAGTTVVEALRAGRHAIGLTTSRWWPLARANVTALKAQGAPGDGMILVRRTSTVSAAQTAGLTGRVALLLTTLRPDSRSSSGLDRLRGLLSECRTLIRPGGHVVITCAPHRHPTRHELLDLPGRILTLGSTVGLAPIATCVALTAGMHGRRVLTHTTLSQRRGITRLEHAMSHPIALSAHQMALVFRADPDTTAVALALQLPPLPEPARHRPASRSPGAVAGRWRRWSGCSLMTTIVERVA